jgi:flagellar assembly factor FliW
MLINTRDFGETEIDDKQIITFPEGVFAFEEDRRFVILAPLGEDKYPCWMQSVDNENLCFIVYNPYEIIADYAPDEKILEKELDIFENTNTAVLSIAVIPEDYLKTTINLKSPVVINLDTKTGKQIVLEQDYLVRFPIFSKGGNEVC